MCKSLEEREGRSDVFFLECWREMKVAEEISCLLAVILNKDGIQHTLKLLFSVFLTVCCISPY